MPEMTLGVILFCSFSGMAFSGAVVWLLGRKARASRRRKAHFPHAFLAGSVTFTLVYFMNRLIFPVRPRAAAAVNLALLAAVLVFPVLLKRVRKKILGRRPEAAKRHPRYAEAAALEELFRQDPLNAFCPEKLSEIYEEMGEHDKALAAAEQAARLDPSVKNKWRADDMKKELQGKKRQKGGWRPRGTGPGQQRRSL